MPEFMLNCFFNEAFHHPSVVHGIDAEVLQDLPNPLLSIPGQLAPTKVLVIGSISHPGVTNAMELMVEAAPYVGLGVTILFGILSVVAF